MAYPLSFAQDVIRCSLCENSVEYYCNFCNVKLCCGCTSSHLSDKTNIHELVNFTSKKDKLACSAEAERNRGTYGDCKDCEMPVGVHSQHDLTELEMVLQGKRSELEGDIKFDDKEYDRITFKREDVICSDSRSKQLEKVAQNKKDIEEKKKIIVQGGNPKEEHWFHGCIPREEAEQLLLKDGDFLVRESKDSTKSDRCFVISAYRQGPVHFFTKNEYILKKFGPGATVVDYVNFLKSSGEPLSPSNAAILINPIARGKSQLVYDNILINVNDRDDKVKNRGMLFRGTYGSAMVFIQKWESQEQAFKNLGLLRKFNHPNIIRLIGYSALERPILLVMEYLSGGILRSYLTDKGSSISMGKRIQMCKDVASGMAYLHHKRCIHRDLAARNCSVNDKAVKISNFWMTEFGEGYQITRASNIPVKWTAPEVLQFEKYTFLSDVWSFGILMWEIFSSGKVPYEWLTNEQTKEKVTSGNKMPAPKGTPKECYDLMLSCWELNPDNRYNFTKIEEKLIEIVKIHQTQHS